MLFWCVPVIVALMISLGLTPVFRAIALRFGWVDQPDGHRKLHSRPVPRIGGAAVMIAFVAGFAVLSYMPVPFPAEARASFPLIWKAVAASFLVFLTGILDDLFNLPPWQKFAGQLAATGIACAAGVHIESIAGQAVASWWAVPLTCLWLLGCTNAFNLIDGTDGLAAGLGLFAALTTLLAALPRHDVGLALATAPLAAALFGFLRYNFNPASVFLGDGGSLWIGFLLGCFGVIWSEKSATLLGMAAPAMALAVPLMDTALAIGRRFLRHQPIFIADRGHIHHRLLDRGFSPRRVVLLLYGAALVAACFALLQNWPKNPYATPIVLLFCATACVAIQWLGFREFVVAARLLRPSRIRSRLEKHIRCSDVRQALQAAATPDERWRIIGEAARSFGFASVSARLAGRTYVLDFGGDGGRLWSVDIPVSDTEYVHLTHPFGSSEDCFITPFIEILHRTATRSAPRMPEPVGRLRSDPAADALLRRSTAVGAHSGRE